MAFEKGHQKVGGRKEGSQNKATTEAREAIARFVDGNASKLQGWLDTIAKESPEKAFTLFQSIIEYHVPKLARSEIDASIKVYEGLVIKEAGDGNV